MFLIEVLISFDQKRPEVKMHLTSTTEILLLKKLGSTTAEGEAFPCKSYRRVGTLSSAALHNN